MSEPEADPCAFPITQSYIEGLLAGIRMYAWWKDGVQYVGTTGRTLEEAENKILAMVDSALEQKETT